MLAGKETKETRTETVSLKRGAFAHSVVHELLVQLTVFRFHISYKLVISITCYLSLKGKQFAH